MDERSKSIFLKCARTYFTVKNWEKALMEYHNLLRDFPDDPFILEPVSICYQNLGKPKEALEFLKKAILAYEAKGHPEKAEKLKPKLQEMQNQAPPS